MFQLPLAEESRFFGKLRRQTFFSGLGKGSVAFQKRRQHERDEFCHGFRLTIGLTVKCSILLECLAQLRADGKW